MDWDQHNQSGSAPEDVLRLFGWQNTCSRALVILNRIILGAVQLLLAAAFIRYWINSYPVQPDECDICLGCGPDHGYGPLSLEDSFPGLVIFDVLAAFVGAFVYYGRNRGSQATCKRRDWDDAVMKKSASNSRAGSLSRIRIAAPCKAEWRFMYGNDRVRFCGQCNLNVYNLSAMTREEAEDLIRRTEGRLCIRFYRRADGTILTQNCPVGLQAIKDKLTSTGSHIIAALLSLLAYIGLLSSYRSAQSYSENSTVVMTGVLEAPRIYPTVGQAVMGIAYPAPEHRRSESFIRNRAVFKVIPVFHSTEFTLTKSTKVVVAVTISEEGEVINAVCTKGPVMLHELAQDAARRWKFEPILVNGNPVRVESTLTFRFLR